MTRTAHVLEALSTPSILKEQLKQSCSESGTSMGDDQEYSGPTTDHLRPPVPVMLAFVALSLALFLVALDTVLIPTTLPSIARSFHLPDSLYAWTGSAYLLSNAASVPVWGRISDVFGRKPVILTANAIFFCGSVICAVSPTAPLLITGRGIQGLGGGGVVVLAHICVSDLFEIRNRSFYLGILGAVWATASALGPVLGGVFAEKVDWRWCFYVNLPIITIASITLYYTLDLRTPKVNLLDGLALIDWLGTFTILIATTTLLVGLQLGGNRSYTNPVVIVLLVVGILAFGIFPVTQWWIGKKGGSPLMPTAIFRDISNLSALAVCGCDALVFNSVAYFLPLYFQLVLGIRPSISGLYMLAVAIPLAIVSFASGYIMNITGHFLGILQIGLLGMTVGVGLLVSLDKKLDVGRIIGFLILIGLGFGPNFSTPLIALQSRIRAADIATGTAAFGFVRMVSGAIGLVVGQVIFQLLILPRLQSLIDGDVDIEFVRALTKGEAVSRAVAIMQLESHQRTLVRTTLMLALRGTWIFYTAVGALGFVVSFGIRRTKLSREKPCAVEEEVKEEIDGRMKGA